MTAARLAMASVGVVLVAAALSVTAFQDPITSDGAYYPLMARVITGQITHPHFIAHQGGIVPHPPLYQLSLAFITAVFGGDFIYYRLFGIFCGVLNCLLIRANVRLLLEGREEQGLASLFAVAAYLLNPFGRIGMLVTDIDYIVIPPPLLLLCYLSVRFGRAPTSARLFHLVAGQALALWSKLTSSLVFPFVFALQMFRRDQKRSAGQILTVAVGGTVLFALTWWLFCVIADYPVLHILRIIRVFRDKAGSENKFLQVGRNVIGSILWFGPAFLLLAMIATRQMFQRALRELETATIYGWVLFGIYLYVGGLAYTLPKYQYPSTALLAIPIGIAIALACTTLRLRPTVVAIAFLVIVVFHYALGDPLYHLFGELRRYAFATGRQLPSEYLRIIGLDLILVVLPIIGCALWARRDVMRWTIGLTIAMFGYDIGLGLRQVRADYVTTYNYGTRGAAQVLAEMRPGAKVLVHEGAMLGLWNTKQLQFVDLPADRISASGQELVSMIEAARADYFVTGLALNTLAQMSSMRSDDVLQRYLKSNYTETLIGDFVLYERRIRKD